MRVVGALLVVAMAAGIVTANFGEPDGFSGRHGPDCSACHVREPAGVEEPVRVLLEGVPEHWSYNTTLELRIAVEGGPQANLVPGRPHGGFDLEVDIGTLTAADGMQGLVRFPKPNEATYTTAGAMVRQWQVVWHPPELTTAPGPLNIWLAVLSANGNHDPEAGSVAGEFGDATASVHIQVEPSAGTVQQWRDRTVPAVELDPLPQTLSQEDQPLIVTGRALGVVDHVEWRVGTGAWTPAFGQPGFLAYLPVLPDGSWQLTFRAVVEGRAGPETSHLVHVGDASALDADTDASASRLPVALLLLVPLLVPAAIKIVTSGRRAG